MWIWGGRVKNGGRDPTESDDECQLQSVHNENEALLMKGTWTGEMARRWVMMEMEVWEGNQVGLQVSEVVDRARNWGKKPVYFFNLLDTMEFATGLISFVWLLESIISNFQASFGKILRADILNTILPLTLSSSSYPHLYSSFIHHQVQNMYLCQLC